MKKIMVACAVVAAQAFISFDAAGQKLSNNAEIMLATGADANGMRKLVSAKNTDQSNCVSAFVMGDDLDALTAALGELGISVNSTFDDFVTATIPIDMLRSVSELDAVSYVSVSNPVALRMDVARKAAGVDVLQKNTDNVLSQPFTGKGVVLGIIDSGIEYHHLAFTDPVTGESRIRRIWNQLATRGSQPDGYNYGVELKTPEEIKSAAYDTSLDFHGSHTTGIAAGSDTRSKYYGVAPDTEIVYVSFDSEDAHIADAINYIFAYADEVGKPCVINMSLGSHFGPHDGTSALDRVIDSATGPGKIIVGAAGNEGEHRLHASKTFTENDTQLKTMLTFHSDVNHKTHYVEVWGTPGTDFQVKACVVESLKGRIVENSRVSSTSDPSMSVAVTVFDLTESGVDASVIISSERSPLNNAPHASVQIEVGDMNTGRMVGLIVEGENGQTVNLWNASLHELSSNNKVGWVNGSNSGTVGEIGATAKRIISVGAYDSRGSFPALNGGYYEISGQMQFEIGHTSVFSSLGPTADGRTAPTILGPGMPVISAYNSYAFDNNTISQMASAMTIDASGKKYYYGYNVGTSMAAPFVAGTIALMLEANPYLTPEEAAEIISETAFTDTYMGQLPNNTYGAGRINSLEAVKKLLNRDAIDEIADYGNRCKVWVDQSANTVNFAVPANLNGRTASIYSTAGAKILDVTLTVGVTTLNAAECGHGVFVVAMPDSTAKIVL